MDLYSPVVDTPGRFNPQHIPGVSHSVATSAAGDEQLSKE